MYCPKCGIAEQSPETFCRGCGTFLPDLDKAKRSANTPEVHVLANTVLSGMTIVASLTLSILLFLVLAFRPGTHPLIYVTAGLLIAMAAWHIQSLWRSLLLRKHFKENEKRRQASLEQVRGGREPQNLLDPADLSSAVPSSITERTTRDLAGNRIRSS